MHKFEIGTTYNITMEKMDGTKVIGADRVVKRTDTMVWFAQAGRRKVFHSSSYVHGASECCFLGETAVDNRKVYAFAK